MTSWFLVWFALTLLGLELLTLRGIAALAGLLALATFFASQPGTAAGSTLIVALAVGGAIALLLEIHVFTGQAVSGVLGLLAVGTAIVLSYGSDAEVAGVESFLTAALAALVTVLIAARIIPQRIWRRRLVFESAQGTDYVTAPDHSELLGAEGVALSTLRPAGVARMGDLRIDVLTAGEFIPAGAAVRVTRVEGARIFVEGIV